MRVTTSGGAEACREKASRHVERIKATFTETTTDRQKFDAFLGAFDRAAWGVGRCRENFEGDNYCRWVNDPATAERLKTSEEEGVLILDMLHQEMAPLMCDKEKRPLSEINGTSAKFAQCTLVKNAATDEMVDTQIVFYEKILGQDLPPTIMDRLRQLGAAFESKIASILAPFLFIPDTLWS